MYGHSLLPLSGTASLETEGFADPCIPLARAPWWAHLCLAPALPVSLWESLLLLCEDQVGFFFIFILFTISLE